MSTARRYPDVVTERGIAPTALGVGTPTEIAGAFRAGSTSRQHQLNQTPAQQAQTALQSRDVGALTRALEANPTLMNDKTFTEMLKKDPFYKENSEQILSSLRAPDPLSPDAPMSADKQRLISQLENLNNPQAADQQPTASRQQPRLPAPSASPV